MLIAALVLAALAGVLHVFIFVLEAFAWEGQTARSIFGTGTPEEARRFRFYAFNQGFYNLFLALMALVGVAAVIAGARSVGITLMLAGTGSMLLAATVLFAASAPHRPAAIKQGALPLAAVACTLLALAI